MAKNISRRNIMKGSLLLLVLFLVEMQVRSTLAVATTKVILQTEHNCGSTRQIDSSEDSTFNVSLQWARPDKNCSVHDRGFYCSATFIQKDNKFANLGMRLCVDIQGVQLDIASMNQLLVTVYDRDRDIKKIYANTRLHPKDIPYYECADPKSHVISVALSVRQSVQICPYILEGLYNNVIRLGSVLSMPIHPITEVNLAKCSSSSFSMSDSNLVKVYADHMTQECLVSKVLHHRNAYMKGCITLKYLPDDFDCEVVVSLYSDGGGDALRFPMDQMHRGETQRCQDFEGRQGFPMLAINAYEYDNRPCLGVFAFQVDFRQVAPPDTPDKTSNSPNLYMAVFITLIAICLVCLGLTCLCCIRFRAKRLRRLQQRSNRQRPASNQGFQHDLGSPLYDGIGWNPSQPAMLFGLPTYDDVVGGHGGGVNPSGDAYKNDLPPAYDSVCSLAED